MLGETAPDSGSARDKCAVQPVAIGGLGGSGTRLLAQVLRDLNYHIGCDLNESLDNLWFTLLFKHVGVRDISDLDLRARYQVFRGRMRGDQPGSYLSPARTSDLIGADRNGQHSHHWLEKRLASLVAARPIAAPPRWGWKEPNSHLVIDHLLRFDPDLHYVHVWRDPLYMSHSRNQNQLRLWGPSSLGNRYDTTARGSLAFWVWAHSRILDVQRAFPDRIHLVSYDDLCLAPIEVLAKLLKFFRIDADEALLERLSARVQPRPGLSTQRLNLDDYDQSDITFLRLQGLS